MATHTHAPTKYLNLCNQLSSPTAPHRLQFCQQFLVRVIQISSCSSNQLLPSRCPSETRPKLCNFLEWRDLKIVYKRYASLYFCMAIQAEDNELITLEIIHRCLWSPPSVTLCLSVPITPSSPRPCVYHGRSKILSSLVVSCSPCKRTRNCLRLLLLMSSDRLPCVQCVKLT